MHEENNPSAQIALSHLEYLVISSEQMQDTIDYLKTELPTLQGDQRKVAKLMVKTLKGSKKIADKTTRKLIKDLSAIIPRILVANSVMNADNPDSYFDLENDDSLELDYESSLADNLLVDKADEIIALNQDEKLDAEDNPIEISTESDHSDIQTDLIENPVDADVVSKETDGDAEGEVVEENNKTSLKANPTKVHVEPKGNSVKTKTSVISKTKNK